MPGKKENFFVNYKKCALVIAIRIKWVKKRELLKNYLNDFAMKRGLVYRIVEEFGTREATDLIVVLPNQAQIWISYLEKTGVYLSRHDACNNIKTTLQNDLNRRE